MIPLVSNATQMLQQEVYRKEFVAVRKSTIEDAERGFITMFSLSMQTLITKVGLIVSLIVVAPKMKAGTYLGALDFLADRILKNKSMKNFLKATLINENANKVKHSLNDNVDISIKDTIYHYNRLIEELAKTLALPLLNSIKIGHYNVMKPIVQAPELKPQNIKPVQQTSKKPIASLFDDLPHKKNTQIDNHPITLILSPFADIDKYAKTATSDLRIENPKKSNLKLHVEVLSQYTHRVIQTKKIVMESIKPIIIPVILKQEDIHNNYASISVKLSKNDKHSKTNNFEQIVYLKTELIPKK
jgi:hypothetical protein